MNAILHGLSKQPFVLPFLVVGAGYALGRLKVKGIGLGATASTLLVGLAISMSAAAAYGINYAVAEFASTVFFNLIMFSIGMKVGPQFIAGPVPDERRAADGGASGWALQQRRHACRAGGHRQQPCPRCRTRSRSRSRTCCSPCSAT